MAKEDKEIVIDGIMQIIAGCYTPESGLHKLVKQSLNKMNNQEVSDLHTLITLAIKIETRHKTAQEESANALFLMADSMKMQMFASRNTITEAYDYVTMVKNALPKDCRMHFLTAIHVLMNTIAERIDEYMAGLPGYGKGEK